MSGEKNLELGQITFTPFDLGWTPCPVSHRSTAEQVIKDFDKILRHHRYSRVEVDVETGRLVLHICRRKPDPPYDVIGGYNLTDSIKIWKEGLGLWH